MKRKLLGLGSVVLIAATSLIILTTCASVGSSGLAVNGHYSFPQIYLTIGNLNFSDVYDPVTGDDVTDATVTATNTTTTNSVNLTYQPDSPRGYYLADANLSHNAGESVSLNIQTADNAITGQATVTPDTNLSNLNPVSSATVNIPFTVSWDVSNNSFNATHVWLTIWGSDVSNNYQALLPIGTTSLEINSSMLQPGIFFISVGAVNRMSIQGASSDSFVVVGSTGSWVSAFGVDVQ